MEERSIMPNRGEFIRMPFHVTRVCEAPVPRSDTVAIVPRPYDLMNTGVLWASISASEKVTSSCRSVSSNTVF